MVDSTVSIASQIPTVQSQVAQVQASVDQLDRAVNAADTSLSNLNNQISDISTHVAQVVGQTVTVGNAIQTAKSAQTAANGLRDQAAASVVTINSQIATTSANLASETQHVAAVAADVTQKTSDLATAAAKNVTVHQAVAVSHSIVGAGADIANAGLDVASQAGDVVATPVVEATATKAASLLDNLAEKASKWTSKEIGTTVHALTKTIGPKIKTALWRYYQVSAQKLAYLDPTRHSKDVTYAGRIKVIRMCLDHATEAVNAYTADVANLGLANIATNPATLRLSDLANASEVVSQDLLTLNAMLVEIATNRCDGTVAIDKPVRAAANDANLWSRWLLNARLSLTSTN